MECPQVGSTCGHLQEGVGVLGPNRAWVHPTCSHWWGFLPASLGLASCGGPGQLWRSCTCCSACVQAVSTYRAGEGRTEACGTPPHAAMGLCAVSWPPALLSAEESGPAGAGTCSWEGPPGPSGCRIVCIVSAAPQPTSGAWAAQGSLCGAPSGVQGKAWLV